MRSSPLLFSATLLLFAGCAVGPDFHSPEAPQTARYTSLRMATTLEEGDGGPVLEQGVAIPQQWWRMYGSPALNDLIAQGLANSNSIAAADARLRQMQENLNAQFGAVVAPSIDATASTSRQKISGAAFGTPSRLYSVHNASVSVGYAIDLFGGSRRYLEKLEAEVDYARFQLAAARLTVAANIVTAAINEASLRGRIAATEGRIADSQARMDLAEQQYALGALPRLEVANRKTALAQVQSELPPLQRQLAQNRHLLSVLVGELPSQDELPLFTLDALHLPESLPLSLPSELVHQRPDILAAEALLHQASADVGVATANLYPRITLSASYGVENSQGANLFDPNSTVWGAAAGLTQPLFHGGELRARKRGAEAAYDEALANYRDVVLQSFRDVADTLQALESSSRNLKLALDAAGATSETLELVQQQFDAGATDYPTLLTARQQHYQAQASLALAAAGQLSDTAALMHAMGGGQLQPSSPSSTEKQP